MQYLDVSFYFIFLLVGDKLLYNTVVFFKSDRMISVRFQDKPFNIKVIQAYAPTCNDEEAEIELLYEDLQDLIELTPPKDVIFIIGTGMQR